jgi:hypothetical protein
MVKEDLWLFAMKYAIDFHKDFIQKDEKSKRPHHTSSSQERRCPSICPISVFGCLAFILDNRLQDEDTLKKWQACSCRGYILDIP